MHMLIFYHSFPHDILPVSVKSPVPRLHLGQVALSEETGRQEEPMSGEMGTSMAAGAPWFGFHSHGGTPIAGWLTMENPGNMDDLGVHPF